MLSSTGEVVVDQDFPTVQQHVAQRAQSLAAKILFTEYVETEQGPYAVLVGVSKPVKGSNLFAVFMDGTRHSMFFVRVRATPEGTSVVASVGGTETMAQFDYGRNKHLVDYLLSGVEGAGLPRRDRA